MEPRRVRPSFDSALRGQTTLPLQEKLLALTTTLLAHRVIVSRHSYLHCWARWRATDLVALAQPTYVYTLRFLGGRQPLWGMGVTSVIDLTTIPAACKARIAASRPGPGPLTKISTSRIPLSWAPLAACWAASCAAYGVLFREPLKPAVPALAQAIVLPWGSVSVMMVLLNVACICAWPRGMFLFSRRGPRLGPGRLLAMLPPLFAHALGSWLVTGHLYPDVPPSAQTACQSTSRYFLARDLRLPATVLRDPRFCRALVRVRCPCTGRFFRCRMPR